MNPLALLGQYVTGDPPKDKVDAPTVSMAALSEEHQRGPQNGPYYGENIDTPGKW